MCVCVCVCVKIVTPPPKSDSPLSQQSPSWSCQVPPLFENLAGGSTPPPQQKRGVHTMVMESVKSLVK